MLTPQFGRVDIVAKGARKSQKRFGGHLELFSRVQCTLIMRDGRDLHTLTDAQQIGALPEIRDDLLRFGIASYGGEVMLRSGTSGQEDFGAYRTLLAWLSLVARVPHGWEEAVLRAGQIRFLMIRGVLAPPAACAVCGAVETGPQGTSFLQTPDLSLVCGSCRDGFGRLSPISPEALSVFRQGADGSLIHGASSPPRREVLQELGKLLNIAVSDFLGSEPKSLSFLESLLAAP